MTIEWILLISFILAVVSLGAPNSITMGLFLGVVPGLLLALAPGVFAYAAVFALLREALPSAPGAAANLAAGAGTLALGLALGLPGHVRGRRAFAAAATDDVEPSEPVALRGHVLVERQGGLVAWRDDPALGRVPDCDALSAALLATPAVKSVTLAGTPSAAAGPSAVTYRLAAKAEAATLRPRRPEAIVDELPDACFGGPVERGDWRGRLERVQAWKAAVEQGWALKLTATHSLVAAPARGLYDQVITIRALAAAGPGRVAVEEVELREGRQLRLRRRVVTGSPVTPLLFPAPEGKSDLRMKWGWARRRLRAGRPQGVRPVRDLFELTDLAMPAEPSPASEAGVLRERIADALADPTLAPGADAFGLVPAWLNGVGWSPLASEDAAVLAALVADPRVADLKPLVERARAAALPVLRAAIARRLRAADAPDRLREQLQALVRRMPRGTYRELGADEAAIINAPALRRRTPAQVERLADQGDAATAPLEALLLADATAGGAGARTVMAVCRAFTRLGPQARPALPTVERLFAMRPNRLANSSADAQAWRVAMVRMGKSVASLPFPNHPPHVLERAREAVLKKAQRAAGEAANSE